MVAFPDKPEPEALKRLDDLGLRSVEGNFGIDSSNRNPCLRYECFKDGRLRIQDVFAEGLDVKLDGRLHICQGFLVGVSLTDHRPFQAKWIGDIPIWTFLDDDLELLYHGVSLFNKITFFDEVKTLKIFHFSILQ